MFKKVFQGGSHVEVFSVQGRDPLSPWRLTGGVTRDYFKDVRGYVVVMEGGSSTTNTRMQLPKADKTSLCLTQPFLVFQLLIPEGARLAVDLGLLDKSGSKRRIQLSTSQREIAVTPLNARVPLTAVLNGQWLNLCLDLGSLVSGLFKAQEFKSLESISLGGSCMLRRIFTLRSPPPDTTQESPFHTSLLEEIPKACQMPTAGTTVHTQVVTYSIVSGPSHEKQTSGLDPTSTEESTATADEQRTHIAFGQKVAIPDHILASKQGNRSALPSRQSSAEKLRGGREGASLEGQGLKPRPPSKPPADPTVLKVQRKRVRMISGNKPRTNTPKESGVTTNSESVDSGLSTGVTEPSPSQATTQSPVQEKLISPFNSVETSPEYVVLDQDEHLALDALKHKDELDTRLDSTTNKEESETVLNTSVLSEDYVNSTLDTSGASNKSELNSSTDDIVYLYRSLPKSAERRSTDIKDTQTEGGRSAGLDEDFVSPVRESNKRGALSFMPPVPQIRQRSSQQRQSVNTVLETPVAGTEESVGTRDDLIQTRLSDDYDWRQYASVDGGDLTQSEHSLRTRLARATVADSSSNTSTTVVRPTRAESGMEGTLSGSVTHSGWTERFKEAAINPLHDSLDTRNMGGMLSPLGGTLTDEPDFPKDQQGSGEGEELELMYDPQLNCFYDPVTGKYYELAQ